MERRKSILEKVEKSTDWLCGLNCLESVFLYLQDHICEMGVEERDLSHDDREYPGSETSLSGITFKWLCMA